MYFNSPISYHNIDKLSCFDKYIDFQCILFRQDFSDRFEHIPLILRYKGGTQLFGLFSLGIFGGPEKDRGLC